MNLKHALFVSFLSTILPSFASAQTLPAPDLSAIRKGLASPEFAQREAAQKSLEQFPLAQVEALRLLVAAEKDPEVKARLEARISAMELHNLVHPPPISLNIKDASWDELAGDLHNQMGPALGMLRAMASDDRKFTLRADQQPFWQVFQQLNLQHPVTPLPTYTLANVPVLRVFPDAPSATLRAWGISDTFAYSAAIGGQPANGTWSITLTFYSDPRVQIACYSPKLQIEKLTDQDGRDLLPLVASSKSSMPPASARALISGTCRASFNPANGLRSLRELRGSVAVALLEKERSVTFDLSNPDLPPLQFGRGLMFVEQDPRDAWLCRWQPNVDVPPAPANSVASTATMMIRAWDADGNAIATSYFPFQAVRSPISMTLTQAPARPVKIEIIWPEKTRDYVIPVDLKDVEVTAPAK